MEMHHLWQVGNERGEHKNSATQTFLKHLYWPDILHVCRDIP